MDTKEVRQVNPKQTAAWAGASIRGDAREMSFQLGLSTVKRNNRGETLTRINTGKGHRLLWKTSEGEVIKERYLVMGGWTSNEMAQIEAELIKQFYSN